MVEISSEEDAQSWLEGKPANWLDLVGLRAALRVVPLLLDLDHQSADLRPRTDLVLQSLRALAATWTVQATGSNDVALLAALKAAREVDTEQELHAAGAGKDDIALFTVNAAIVSGNAYAFAGQAAEAFSRATTAYVGADPIWRSISADAIALEDLRKNPIELAKMPLWPDEVHPTFASLWALLRDRMNASGNDWDVWVTWYQDRLDGKAYRGDVDLWRVLGTDTDLITKEDWEEPATVNAKIARFEMAWAVRNRPTAARADLAPDRGEIVERPPRQRPTEPDETPAPAWLATQTRQLNRRMRPLRDVDGNAPYAALARTLDALDEVLAAGDDPLDFHDECEAAFNATRRMVTNGTLPDRDETIEAFQKTLGNAMAGLQSRYPEIGREVDYRQVSRHRRLTDQELAAVEDALVAIESIVADEFREVIDKELDTVREAEAAEMAAPDVPLPDGDLKRAVYRLKSWFLQIRRLAKTPREQLEKMLDKGVATAKRLEEFRKASDTLDTIWQKLRDFFLSGPPGG